MPKFPKNTDYKMKGSTFYGLGSSSPAKISDQAVVDAQKSLDHTQLDFREPGWATVARGAHEAIKSTATLGMMKGKGKKKGKGKGSDEPTSSSNGGNGSAGVQDIAKKNELKVNEDLMSGGADLDLKMGSMGSGGFGG